MLHSKDLEVGSWKLGKCDFKKKTLYEFFAFNFNTLYERLLSFHKCLRVLYCLLVYTSTRHSKFVQVYFTNHFLLKH